MSDEHMGDAFQLEEGDEVRLELDDGGYITGTITDRTRNNSPEHVPAISEQTIWTILDEPSGNKYRYGIVRGISPHEGGQDAYPSHLPVHPPDMVEFDQDEVLGYIEDVEIL